MRLNPHIIRFIALLAVLLQVSLPFTQARAAEAGTPLSALICNPSGQPLDTSAQASVTDLLKILGQSETPDPMPDCERCVVPGVAVLLAHIGCKSSLAFSRAAHRHPVSARVSLHPVRGPPCGTRAPPHFV